ncbi:hypothetical protein PVBG_06098 [Plasmodium vivax Brazil I]|uniref:Uncharacterized protein n=1 Tax=Plasmodium vivax (strain Brazil I) TaxID=1033975 RepID=A0A0J9VNC8_PLAV1|nr:hypothetical protein PVBG_06098 [Plasmodium vivax Brazil I]
MLNVHYIDDQIKLSEHLSYWIYDSTKNSKTCNRLDQLYDDLKTNKSYYFPNDKSIVQNFSITGDGFIKKKSLFLNGEILYWIVYEKEKIADTQSTSYDKYRGECFKFYKKIMCTVNPSIMEEYRDELTTFENNFNTAISTLKEKGVKITKEKITLPDASICNMEWENVEERAELQDAIEGAITEDTGSIYTGKKEPVSSIGGPQGKDADKGEILPSEPQESAGLASLASIDLNGAGNIREPSETIMPKNVGTIGASVAGSSLFLLMMYKVKKHRFNKYYAFMLILILH